MLLQSSLHAGKRDEMAQPAVWQELALSHHGCVHGNTAFFFQIVALCSLGYRQLVQNGFGETNSFEPHEECVLGDKGTKHPRLSLWEGILNESLLQSSSKHDKQCSEEDLLSLGIKDEGWITPPLTRSFWGPILPCNLQNQLSHSGKGYHHQWLDYFLRLECKQYMSYLISLLWFRSGKKGERTRVAKKALH